jgi:hypothetical protein
VTTYQLGQRLPRIDISVRAGQALEFSVPVLDGVRVVVPAAELVSARAQVRPLPTGGELLHEFSTDDGNAEITADGLVVLTATPQQTTQWGAAWPATGAWWDLEVTDAAGKPHPLTAPGRLAVAKRITQ